MEWDREFIRLEKKSEFKFESLKIDVTFLIQRTLERKGWSEDKFRKECGMTKRQYEKILKCEHNFKLSEIARISEVLDIKVSLGEQRK